MPRYTIQDPTGRRLVVEGATPPTPRQIKAIFDANPVTPTAGSVAPPAPDEGGVWESVKQGGKGLLELVGRPGEFVSGFVGGAAQGGVGEGLRRGAAAAFEPTLTDSKIQENFAKVMEEQGVLKDSPLARSIAGFAGDVMLDPINLLGGAGILRRGAIKAAGTLGKAAEAERLLTAPNRAFAAAVKPLGEATRAAAAKTPGVRALMVAPELVGLKGRTGQDAQEMTRIAAARRAARTDIGQEAVDKINADLRKSLEQALPGLTPLQYSDAATTLSMARQKVPAAMQKVAADPGLSKALSGLSTILDDIDNRELITKAIREPYLPTLDKDTLGAFNTLTGRQQQAVLAPLRAIAGTQATKADLLKAVGNIGSTLPTSQQADRTLMKQLQKIGTRIVENITADDGTILYDPRNLRLHKTAKGEMQVEKLNSLLHYVPVVIDEAGKPAPATVFRAINPTLKESMERSLSFPEAVAKGAKSELPELVARRIASNVRAEESVRLIDEFSKEFGQANAQTGFRQFSKSTREDLDRIPALSAVKDQYFPEAIANEVEKQIAILNDPSRMENFYHRMGKLWKGFATSLNFPAYPSTNFMSNTLAMHLAGMGPDQIAAELYRSYKGIKRADTILAAQTATNDVFKLKHFSDQEVLQLAKEYGTVGRSGSFATEFRSPDNMTDMAKAITTGEWNPLNPEMRGYNWMRGAGQKYVEDPAKLALFVHELRKMDNVKALSQAERLRAVNDSTLTVMKFLFNYGDLSPLERDRLAGSIIPFYTFTRKNVPLYMASLVNRPGRVTQQNRLLKLIDEIGRQDPEAKAEFDQALPSYLKEPGQVRLRTSAGQPVRGKLKFPLVDIHRPFNFMANPGGEVGELLNPALRIPIETIIYGETFRGQPIREGYGRPTPIGNLLGLSGTLPGGQRLQSNLSRYLTQQVPLPFSSVLSPFLSEAKDAGSLPLWEDIAYRMAGIPTTEITPEIYARGMAELRRKKADMTRAQRNEAIGNLLK